DPSRVSLAFDRAPQRYIDPIRQESMYVVARRSPNCAARVAKGKIARTACSPIRLLRSGGVLIYSICRLKPEENQQLVERLLEEFPRMRCAGKILPPLSRPLRRCFCGTPHSVAGR